MVYRVLGSNLGNTTILLMQIHSFPGGFRLLCGPSFDFLGLGSRVLGSGAGCGSCWGYIKNDHVYSILGVF